ncbi:Putative amine oxidase, SWIRM domain, Homeobox-like domain superfamily [Septoria linicola]|uniref:Amine oxidase, SWIRM domain, Homeobox-like domain superfamily n=1 Tax=Septoria linicola TaxID=215465 RepID=A0A9Q9AYK9_9PEZI|nr:Putative amine oxidase, SWIRM domain, Homeobox-like domain superfamily [Septoria linicola]
MAGAVEDIGYMAPTPGLVAGTLGRDIKMPQLSIMEEDDSSLSSTGTEVFDRDASGSSQKERWQLDANGKWRQHGASESATSTGISSMCSSVAAEDIVAHTSAPDSPSRKRLADGSLKGTPSKPHSSTLPTASTEHTGAQPAAFQSEPPPKKKRGRPPKVKPVVTDADTNVQPTADASPKVPRLPKFTQPTIEVRPRSSIPSKLPADIYASECVEAAYESRLDPYALDPGENRLLMDLLMSNEVTIYLNIRNAILRLWQQNPLCSVTREEAAGCAKESRFFGLAEVAHKWLSRNGYINFGCVEVAKDKSIPKRYPKDTRQRTVVVIGAGVSGLTTARQLESLFTQEAAKWIAMGERPPRVIVLEGRKRIGGRVYSKPLRSQVTGSLPDGLRNTAEMGAMIVTGFEHGNPLDTIIRGQLGVRYHLMKDALTIYDCNGRPVDERRDILNTELYTDISDRAGEYRIQPQKQDTLKGDEDLINRHRDPATNGFSAFDLEPLTSAHVKAHKPATRRGRRRNAPPGTEKLTGRSEVMEEAGSTTHSASRAARNMGWEVKEGVARNQSVSLHRIADSSDYPTLGTVMDEAINQYQDLIDLTPQDMRLLNWHHANLEYANAAPVSMLSLSGHDQDTGNEFEGAHSEIIGGYSQVPRGLMNLPTKLDVHFDRIVDSIHYDDGTGSQDPVATKVVCTNGEVYEADEVIVTTPLGVLKSNAVDFDPPLPSWKQGAIDRLGFGLLNKVILLYDKPFWDNDRDMFGLLNEAERVSSLDPSDYASRRGRFYLIWNATKTSGRPMLIALMAGNAAHDAEWTPTSTLMNEVTERLRGVFTSVHVPAPLEVIVTRWRRDPFTRGTYSYVAPETRPGDYDLMSRSVGNLHFAGEATCGTHPATVHGAFLSGLRVASEVIDDMAGLITIPHPLIGPASMKEESTPKWLPAVAPSAPRPQLHQQYSFASLESDAPAQPFIKQEDDGAGEATSSLALQTESAPPPLQRKQSGPPAKSVCAGDASFWVSPSYDGSDLDYEAAVMATILGQLGDRPIKPSRPGVNPFILFTKDKWEVAKATVGIDGRNMIRNEVGRLWRTATEEEKQPYLAQSQAAQELADALRRDYEDKSVEWDRQSARIRREYAEKHPPPANYAQSIVGVSKRKTNTSNNVVLDHN